VTTEQANHFVDNLTRVAQSPMLGGADAVTAIDKARSRIARAGLHLATGDRLDYGDVKAVRLPDGATAVHVPIVGAASAGSGVTVQFGVTSVAITEIQIHLTSALSARAMVWSNGRPTVNTVATASALPASVHTEGINWSALTECLASKMGIPAAVLAAIIVVCLFTCAATAGAGCIACLAVALGFTGGAISYCVAQAVR
jgi:hypothetical protein